MNINSWFSALPLRGPKTRNLLTAATVRQIKSSASTAGRTRAGGVNTLYTKVMASAMFKKKYQRHKRSYGEAGVSLASDAEALLEEGIRTVPGPPHHALSLSKEERKRKFWRWCNMRAACRSDRSIKYVLVFMSIFSLTSMLLSFKVVGTLHGQVKNSPLRMEEGQCKPVPAERLDGLAYICNGKGCQIDLLCFSMSLMRLQSQYEGRIYVVTDRDDLFEGKACGNNAPEYEAIPFQNSSSTTRMHMKLTRAKLFDMIPDRNAKSLIYIDADILPVGCLHDFLAAEDPSSIGLFLDSWCPDCNTYLTALMYMKKTDKTSACLSEWSKEALREGGTAYHKVRIVLRRKTRTGRRIERSRKREREREPLFWFACLSSVLPLRRASLGSDT